MSKKTTILARKGPGRSWLFVLGRVEGLRWVAENNRMAFTEGLARRAEQIQPGDELFLYMGRSAYNNPTRDRSELIGLADVGGPVRPLRRPVLIAGRQFVAGCDLRMRLLLPERNGVAFPPLVPHMQFILRKEVWSAYMRTALIQLSASDAATLRRALAAARRSGS